MALDPKKVSKFTDEELSDLFDEVAPLIEQGYQKGIGVAINQLGPLNVTVSTKMGNKLSSAALAKLKEANLKYVNDLGDRYEKIVYDVVYEGLDKGRTLDQIMTVIQETADKSILESKKYASNIIIDAARKGEVDLYAEAKIKLFRDIAVVDNRTCGVCLGLNGNIYEEAFNDKGLVNYDTGEYLVDELTQLAAQEGLDDFIIESGDGPQYHPHCLLPDIRCESPSDIISCMRAWYDGLITEVTFSNGTSISVTPNHMLLTPYGFSAANLLMEGDYVFCSTDFERIHCSHPDDTYIPPTIEEIFNTVFVSSTVIPARVPHSPEYLHGDATFCDGNIDIVWPDSSLSSVCNSKSAKHIGECCFNPTNSNLPHLSSNSAFAFLLYSLASSSGSSMGGSRKSHPFFFSRLSHSGEHSIRPVPDINSILTEDSINWASGAFEEFRECLNRFPGFVECNQIISINFKHYSGYVYDLQTKSSVYIGNKVLVSNCRCHLAPVITFEDYKGKVQQTISEVE